MKRSEKALDVRTAFLAAVASVAQRYLVPPDMTHSVNVWRDMENLNFFRSGLCCGVVIHRKGDSYRIVVINLDNLHPKTREPQEFSFTYPGEPEILMQAAEELLRRATRHNRTLELLAPETA